MKTSHRENDFNYFNPIFCTMRRLKNNIIAGHGWLQEKKLPGKKVFIYLGVNPMLVSIVLI